MDPHVIIMPDPTEATSVHSTTLCAFNALHANSPVRGQSSREQAHAAGHGVEAPADGAWLGHRSDVAPWAGSHSVANFLRPCS